MPKFSEQERLKHPLLKRIPVLLWYTLFVDEGVVFGELSDNQLELMGTALDVPSERLDDLSDSEKLKSWLCVLISHPKAKAKALVTKAASLGLSTDIVVAGALVSNRVDILRTSTPNVIPASTTVSLLYYATFSGSLDPLKWLGGRYSKAVLSAMIREDDGCSFRLAARGGHLEVLKWLEKNAKGSLLDMIKAQDYRAFLWAAREGHLHVLKWIAGKAPLVLSQMIKAYDYRAFNAAVKKGQLKVLKWIAEKAEIQFLDIIKVRNYEDFQLAACEGHLEVL